jgi:hypothetical protein
MLYRFKEFNVRCTFLWLSKIKGNNRIENEDRTSNILVMCWPLFVYLKHSTLLTWLVKISFQDPWFILETRGPLWLEWLLLVKIVKKKARNHYQVKISFFFLTKFYFIQMQRIEKDEHMVTYENVENHFSQNCRKWKMTPYSKMPKVE